jgi:hypothetical protein
LLLVFQAAATVFACPGDGRFEFSPSTNHAHMVAADNASPNCGASAAPDSASDPFLPDKEPARQPHQDCPACQVFGCHISGVLTEQSRVVGAPVADEVSWFVRNDTRPDGEFASVHNKDPPFSLPL